MSDEGNTVYMNMEKSTNGSPNSFTTVFSGQRVDGWSGANIRYFSPIRFGSPSQSGNANKIRLTFYQTAINTSYGSSCVLDIRFYGNAAWIKANSMMATNHMYSWDADMNVTFPANVTATYFNGTATQVAEIIEDTNTIKSGSSAISAGIVVAGDDGLYKNLKTGTAFNVRYQIYYARSTAANTWISKKWSRAKFTITGTQSITLTQGKPVYIKGHLNGTMFTPISTAPLTQTIPTSADGCQYIFLGVPHSATGLYMMPEHPIYQFRDGKFDLYSNDSFQVRYDSSIYANSNITAGNIIVANYEGKYYQLNNCSNFDIRNPILYAGANISANKTGNDNYIMTEFAVGTTQSITLTPNKPVYIKGTLHGTTFIPISSSPLVQMPDAIVDLSKTNETVAVESDENQYILLGIASSTNSIYLSSEHPIHAFLGNAFQTAESFVIREYMNSHQEDIAQ